MQICNNFLPVPVLAEPDKVITPKRTGEVRESNTGAAVESGSSELMQAHALRGADTGSRSGRNKMFWGEQRAGRRQSFRMFSTAACLA